MENKSNIVIDLNDSTYAHGFKSENQIHKMDLEKAMGLIGNLLDDAGKKEDESISISHHYKTIGIFGDRGSGKTSFLITLLEKCREKFSNVEILRIIDPTLIEHKKPIALVVISMINEVVEKSLKNKECELSSNTYVQRRTWQECLRLVSMGLFSVDKVGKDFDNALWQDEDYVLHTGLEKVKQSNCFEENIRKMITVALDILGKEALSWPLTILMWT